MGHSSINVTVNIYGHLVPGGNRAAVDKLDMQVSEKAEQASESGKCKKVVAMVARTGQKIRLESAQVIDFIGAPGGI